MQRLGCGVCTREILEQFWGGDRRYPLVMIGASKCRLPIALHSAATINPVREVLIEFIIGTFIFSVELIALALDGVASTRQYPRISRVREAHGWWRQAHTIGLLSS